MITGIEIREVPHGGPAYQELVRLRDLHLRQPVGLRIGPDDLAGEEGQRHFAMVENGTFTGGLIAAPLGAGLARLRQMWIDPALRGGGRGRILLDAVEATLAAAGIRRLTLHAREEAVGFYKRSGYTASGPVFTEVGLPHRTMEKTLAGPGTD